MKVIVNGVEFNFDLTNDNVIVLTVSSSEDTDETGPFTDIFIDTQTLNVTTTND